ncbi:MAG: PorV/PorQ family protein [bacterium]|nr:PorV/PorQ family protein [bacterium]
MKNKKILVIIFILILALSVFAAESAENAGLFPMASFLKVSLDPRGFAMGEASVAFGDSLSAGIFYNPAALGRLNKSEFTLGSYYFITPEIKMDYFGLAKNFGDIFTLSFGVIQSDTGEQDKTDVSGSVLGTFNNKSSATFFSFGGMYGPGLFFGFGIKYVEESLAGRYGKIVTTDIGTIYIPPTFSRLGFGVSIMNIPLSQPVQFIEENTKLATTYKIGWFIKAIDTEELIWTFAWDNNIPQDGRFQMNLGTEFNFYDFLYIRAGDKIVGYDLNEATFGFGLGLSEDMSLDYCYSTRPELGATHRFAFSLKFGKPREVKVDTTELDALKQQMDAERQAMAEEEARRKAEEEARRLQALADQQKQTELLAAQQKLLEEERKKLEDAMKNAAEDKNLEIREESRGLVLNLVGINFASGSATIPSSAYQSLDRAAAIIQSYPDVQIRIEGHTDSIGPETSNQTLSQQRAESVRNYLIQKAGIPSHLITAYGFGESKPIASNDTEEGRFRNRRVEIILLTGNQGSSYSEPTPYYPPTPTYYEEPAPSYETPMPESSGGEYTVYVGSHKTVVAAEREISQLKQHGYSAEYVQVDVQGKGTYYRVKVGSYDSATANQIKADLASQGFDAWISH